MGSLRWSTSYFNEHKTIIRGFHRFHGVARGLARGFRGSNIVEVLLKFFLSHITVNAENPVKALLRARQTVSITVNSKDLLVVITKGRVRGLCIQGLSLSRVTIPPTCPDRKKLFARLKWVYPILRQHVDRLPTFSSCGTLLIILLLSNF